MPRFLLALFAIAFLFFPEPQWAVAQYEKWPDAPEFQKDLKLSDAQVVKIKALFQELRSTREKLEANALKTAEKRLSPEEVDELANKTYQELHSMLTRQKKELQQLLSVEQFEKFEYRTVQLTLGIPSSVIGPLYLDIVGFDQQQMEKAATLDRQACIGSMKANYKIENASGAEKQELQKKLKAAMEKTEKMFFDLFTQTQHEKLNEILQRTPSYVLYIASPEELTDYSHFRDKNNKSLIAAEVQVLLTEGFQDIFQKEAGLQAAQREKLILALNQLAKKQQALARDYVIDLVSGVDIGEAAKTLAESEAVAYTEFNAKIHGFLSQAQCRLLQQRMLQSASGNTDFIITVFVLDEIEATQEQKQAVMTMRQNHLRGSFVLDKSLKNMTDQNKKKDELEKKHKDFENQEVLKVAKTYSDTQKIKIAKITQQTPDYIKKIQKSL
ncbi:MAG: hypothetical protein FWC50_09280 [Planctomycetaceae bacterium]|nr:hypothetical protein [Planctomycetaceae bacterium]